jgi:hypothetical protein
VAAETPAKNPADATSLDASGGASGAAAGSNRRAHRRLRPEELSKLAGARLASGAEIKLIDLSRGGAQFESDRRFLPNSTVSLRLVTTDSTFVVHGRVVRSRIVRLDKGGLGYNVAVAFNELLQHLPDEALEPSTEARSTPDEGDIPEAIESIEPTEAEPGSDVTPEEAAAFEASVEQAPTMLTVTAEVRHTDEELLDLFNGNDW